MKILSRIACLTLLFYLVPVQAREAVLVVSATYLDVRTGPGRGYPVFYVVEEGAEIIVDKKRTDWYRIRTSDRSSDRHSNRGPNISSDRNYDGKAVTGWVRRSEIEADSNGGISMRPDQSDADADEFRSRRWEWSLAGGDFAGASAISASLAYRMTSNLSLQLEGKQLLGEFSDGWMLGVNIKHQPFPSWRISPYLKIGTGVLQTNPFSTIVQSEDRTDQTLNVGGGANIYLSRQFSLFIDYSYHTVLTSRNNFEEIQEWKLGFNIFL